MDANMKKEQAQMRQKVEDQRRLEMYRKLRADMKEEDKQEKEAAYQTRVAELDKKDKAKPAAGGDAEDWMNDIKAFGEKD